MKNIKVSTQKHGEIELNTIIEKDIYYFAWMCKVHHTCMINGEKINIGQFLKDEAGVTGIVNEYKDAVKRENKAACSDLFGFLTDVRASEADMLKNKINDKIDVFISKNNLQKASREVCQIMFE